MRSAACVDPFWRTEKDYQKKRRNVAASTKCFETRLYDLDDVEELSEEDAGR